MRDPVSAPRSAVVTLALAMLAACPGDPEKGFETADTSPSCPTDLESFCEAELGGACPTLEAASTMTCNDYHFDPTGTSTGSPDVYGPDESCASSSVMCNSSSSGRYTWLYFTDGELRWARIEWPETDSCPGSGYFGTPEC